MNIRGLSALLLLLLTCATGAAAVELFPLDEVRPGLAGTAFTVFKGDSIESFGVEILDRVPGVAGRDLILVKALGPRFERAGVSRGMSGSPVYVDGRLLGALAFNFSFSADALAYVTPAGAMMALADRSAPGPRADAGARRLRAFPFPGLAGDGETPAAADPLPLSVAGFDPAALSDLTALCRGLGFSLNATSGAATGGAASGAGAAPRPGGAIAVALLTGPVTAAAYGTVTHVEGDRVWGFGHPFLNAGDCELPLAGAVVHGVLPSLDNSFKISSLAGVVGTLLYDGQAGIYGRLDGGPDMLPLAVALRRASGEVKRADFAVARHEALQSALVRMAVEGWLSNRLAALAEGRLEARLTVSLGGDAPDEVELAGRFGGEGAIGAAANWIQAITDVLTVNPAGPLPVTGLALECDWRAGGEPRELLELSIDRPAVRAGEAWDLRLRLREGVTRTTETLTVPARSGGLEAAGAVRRADDLPPGSYRVHCADASTFQLWNAARQPALYGFDDHASVLAVLSTLEGRDDWVVWISGPGERAVVDGREVTLPVWIRELRSDGTRQPNEAAAILLGGARIALPPEVVPVGYGAVDVTILPEPKRARSEQ